MATYNPHKKIKIEIRAKVGPAFDYEIWAIAANKCVARNACDSEISEVLTSSQFSDFMAARKYTFTTTADKLATTFSYLY